MSDDNPARPKPGAPLCPLDKIPPNGAIILDFAEGTARFSMLVTRSDDSVSAFENLCPHARWPLERPDGRVIVHEQRYIICAVHGASFRMDDGRCVAGPGLGGSLRLIPVTVLGGIICCA